MAKISNTTVYPTVTPTDDDLLILTDANDSNRTKTVKMSGVKSYVNSLSEGVYTKSVTLSSPDLLNITSAPVLIAGEPGYHIDPISIVGKYTYGTANYTGNYNLYFTFGAGNANPNAYYAIPYSNFVNVEDTAFGVFPLNYTSKGKYFSLAGGDAFLAWATVDYTSGDGTLTFDIMYRLVKA
tara:strand:+ start:1634 stop:2179 length:546 start_codon:yes stop_codon:yes gene_type:complete